MGVGIAATILVIVELVLRLSGAFDYRDRPDPFGGFAGLPSLFEQQTNEGGAGIYVARKNPGAPRTFLADKPENAFRVFVLGGSSEAGTPYGYEHAFPNFLQALLEDALPDRHIEVVNAAQPGFASRRVLYVARELASYAPDLLIVCTGHNEVVEQRLYAHLYERPAWLLELQNRLRRLSFYVAVEDLQRRLVRTEGVVIDGNEVYAPMFGPMGTKHWKDEPRDAERQRTLALMMFETNLTQIVRAARAAGAEVMLVSQAKNYVDWPVVGQHRLELTEDQHRQWAESMTNAVRLEAEGDLDGAIDTLRTLLTIDAGHAEVYWRLARIHRARGDHDEAFRLYRRAHNTTLANFGTTPERNAMLAQVARDEDTLWVDMDAVFETSSTDGMVGFNWFVDFLHPNLAGHRLIAQTIFAALRARGVPEPAAGWREPDPLPTPEELYADDRSLLVREIRNKIVAAIVSEHTEEAARYLEELRRVDPDDPRLPQLEQWASAAGGEIGTSTP